MGEKVKLTFSGNDANWTISGGEGTVEPTGKTSIYSASITAADETITAVDTKTGATATITFDVIRPTGLFFERDPGGGTQVYHHQGWPDIGFAAKVYLLPTNVSFEYINVREEDAPFVATGYYTFDNGESHKPAKEPETVQELVPGKGWRLEKEDSVWTGYQPRPFDPGYVYVDIPWSYDAYSEGEAGPFHIFAYVQQKCELESDGKTLHAAKGQADLTLTISSPDYQ